MTWRLIDRAGMFVADVKVDAAARVERLEGSWHDREWVVYEPLAIIGDVVLAQETTRQPPGRLTWA